MSALVASIGSLVLLSHAPGALRVLLARLARMRIDRVVVGVGPILRRGQLEIRAVPIGTFVLIAGRDATGTPADPSLFASRPWPLKLMVLLAAPLAFYLIATAIMALVYLSFGVPIDGHRPIVGELVSGLPAERAGLQRGDEIISIDHKPMTDTTQVAPAISSGGPTVEIEIVRDGAARSIVVAPIRDGNDGRIGIEIWPKEESTPATVGAALAGAAKFPFQYTRFIGHGLAQIARGEQKAELTGSAGVIKVTERQAKQGWRQGLQIIAIWCVYFGLQLGLYDGARLLAYASRHTVSSSTRDLGEIVPSSQRMTAGVIIALSLIALFMVALVANGKLGREWEGAVLGVALAFGLLSRQPAAWSLVRGGSLVFAAILLLEPATRLGALVFLPLFLLFNARSTRRWFGLYCPACDGGDARAVLGHRHSFGCLRCGSSWISRA